MLFAKVDCNADGIDAVCVSFLIDWRVIPPHEGFRFLFCGLDRDIEHIQAVIESGKRFDSLDIVLFFALFPAHNMPFLSSRPKELLNIRATAKRPVRYTNLT